MGKEWVVGGKKRQDPGGTSALGSAAAWGRKAGKPRVRLGGPTGWDGRARESKHGLDWLAARCQGPCRNEEPATENQVISVAPLPNSVKASFTVAVCYSTQYRCRSRTHAQRAQLLKAITKTASTLAAKLTKHLGARTQYSSKTAADDYAKLEHRRHAMATVRNTWDVMMFWWILYFM